MTNAPDFNDLTPPADELIQWRERNSFWAEDIQDAYRAGARHGWEQARQLWPEPITSRPPTKEDADRDGFIQCLDTWNHWVPVGVETALASPPPEWMHTVNWQPRQPSPVDTLAAIIREVDGYHRLGAGALAEAILSHPDARRALEQAGEGKA